MTVPITLNNVTTFQNDTTAATTVNNNSTAITTAFGTALARTGDQMTGNLDMNSSQILNLPAPSNQYSPLRLVDANTLNGGGTISGLPTGGTTNQVLAKNSATNYDVGWQTPPSANISAGTNIVLTGSSPTSIATTTTPTFTTVNGNTITAGTGTLTIAAAKTLTASNSLTLAGTDGTTMTFPGTSDSVTTSNNTQTLANKTLTSPTISTISNTGTLTLPTSSDTLVGRNTTDTLTNKTFDSASNTLRINGVATSRGQFPGTNTNDAAVAGNVGEVVSSNIVNASAVALTSGTAANVTSISLTPGNWKVWGTIITKPAGTTTTAFAQASVNTVSATIPSDSSINSSLTQLWMPNTSGTGGSTAGGGMNIPISPAILSLSTTTTVYLVAAVTFATSTMSASGSIIAERIR